MYCLGKVLWDSRGCWEIGGLEHWSSLSFCHLLVILREIVMACSPIPAAFHPSWSPPPFPGPEITAAPCSQSGLTWAQGRAMCMCLVVSWVGSGSSHCPALTAPGQLPWASRKGWASNPLFIQIPSASWHRGCNIHWVQSSSMSWGLNPTGREDIGSISLSPAGPGPAIWQWEGVDTQELVPLLA